jgi:hypothetical protein
MKQPLTVLGFGAVAPYTPADAPHGTPDARFATDASGSGSQRGERPLLDLALLERTLRRGLSDVTRLFMHAAKLALDDAGREPTHMHVIFASALGEIGTAEALLAEAYDANGSSPARFRNSVHNTAAGLLSISTHNRLACTAIAAGWETVPMALCEAAAQLASQAETVLLVFAEERVPRALSDQHPHGPLGAAFVLTRAAAPGVRARGTLVNLRRQPHNEQVALAAPLEPHPLASALALVEALSTTERRPRACTLALSDGENPWCVDVHAGEPS